MSSRSQTAVTLNGHENRLPTHERLENLETQIAELQSLVSDLDAVIDSANRRRWSRRKMDDDDLAEFYEAWLEQVKTLKQSLRTELDRRRALRGQVYQAIDEVLDGHQIPERDSV